MSESLEEKIKRMQAEKEAVKAASDQKLVEEFTGSEQKKDFMAIAEELKKRKEQMEKGKNTGFTKDTIYVRDDIYQSFNALCIKQGDKKRLINQALAEFVEREYKKLQEQE